MKYKTHTNIGIISVLVIIAVFYAGMKYGQSQSSYSGNGQAYQQGQGGNRAGRGMGARGGGGGGVSGQIVSLDTTSITVQQRDGSSKIVFLAGSTSVTKSAPGSASDLVVGQQVNVMGTANSDGSETAQFVQIRPTQPQENQKVQPSDK